MIDVLRYIEKMKEMYEGERITAQEPRNMADGGRIGFYRGESVVKSHGDKIIKLGEAGESSVSIAKKLKLKQQTVNNAINSIEEGLAGKKYKFSKPFKELEKLSINQWIMRSDEEIQKIIDKPKYEGWSKKDFRNKNILTRTETERATLNFTEGKPGMPKKKLEDVFELLHDGEIEAFKAGDLSEDRIRQLYRSRRNQKNLRMPFPKNAEDALYSDFYLGSQNKNSRYKIVKGTSFGNKKYPNTTDLRKVKFKDTLTNKILTYEKLKNKTFDFKQTVMKNGKMTLGKSMPYDNVLSAYEFKINLNQHPEIKTKINQAYVKGWDEMPSHVKARSGQAYSVQHNLAKHLDPANTSFSFFDQNKNEYNIKKDFLDKFNKKLPYSKKKVLYQTYKTRLATEAPDVVSTFGKHTTGTPMDVETFIKKSGVRKTKDVKKFLKQAGFNIDKCLSSGGRVGFANPAGLVKGSNKCIIGVINDELKLAKKSGNVAKFSKFGKLAKGAGYLFGWVDIPIELAFALPSLLAGDVQGAKRATTAGLFGYGGKKLDEIDQEKNPEVYKYFKHVQDINDWMEAFNKEKIAESKLEELPEGYAEIYKKHGDKSGYIDFHLEQYNEAVAKQEDILKNYIGYATEEGEEDLKAQEIARQGAQEYLGKEVKKGWKEGMDLDLFLPPSMRVAKDVFGLETKKVAPFKPDEITNLEDLIKQKGDPFYGKWWKRGTRYAAEELGAEEKLYGDWAERQFGKKDPEDIYSELPLEYASQLAALEKKEVMKDPEYKYVYRKPWEGIGYASGGLANLTRTVAPDSGPMDQGLASTPEYGTYNKEYKWQT